VLPDGGGLARYVKFPGAPIMTIVLGWLAYRWWVQRSQPRILRSLTVYESEPRKPTPTR
jgi:hypothetical protein